MNKEINLPEGFAIVWTAMFMIIVFMFFIIKAFAYEENDEESFAVEFEEPIPIEEQIENDPVFRFQEKEQEIEESKYLIDVTQEDIDLMARVVMSEGSILSDDAKQGIAQTIVNRVRTDYKDFKNQNTVSEVVFYPNAYSVHDNGEPTAECYAAVAAALIYEGFPTDMFWFREDHYHEFGTEYCHIGTMYFSRGISDGN